MIKDNRMVLINQARKDQGYSIREFCRKVGITTPTFYNLLNKKTSMNDSLLILMADLLRVELPDENENCKKKAFNHSNVPDIVFTSKC